MQNEENKFSSRPCKNTGIFDLIGCIAAFYVLSLVVAFLSGIITSKIVDKPHKITNRAGYVWFTFYGGVWLGDYLFDSIEKE